MLSYARSSLHVFSLLSKLEECKFPKLNTICAVTVLPDFLTSWQPKASKALRAVDPEPENDWSCRLYQVQLNNRQAEAPCPRFLPTLANKYMMVDNKASPSSVSTLIISS